MNCVKKSFALALTLCLCLSSSVFSAEWKQKKEFTDDNDGSITVEATYFAAEYVERATQEQAEKNLWTADEAENYRYNLLQQLRLEDTIPIFIKFKNIGSPLRMAPFDRQIELRIGKNVLSPVDFDKRFNFKVVDEREGFVYFPRYNEKGKPYLTPKIKSVRLTINGSISPVTMGKSMDFFWDVKDDDPNRLYKGKAGARMEMDRLIKRLGNLTKKGKELQSQLDEVQDEIKMINTRMMELQGQQ
ncbi:MAG: hypothetical protein SOZ52_04715 [Pyramidobacter sp.]|nr:hypothetical protein [Pyramidobacter sp.]